MYKNIVFDFGGVMVDFAPHKYLIDLFGNRGLEEEVYDLPFGSREWRLLDAGRITRREANERMLQRARAVGRGFEVEGVLDDWMSMLRPRRRMQPRRCRMCRHSRSRRRSPPGVRPSSLWPS